jgi:NAD(P)-dependent dehydrogenase (short-subunit alcohol dehydrogenase family)
MTGAPARFPDYSVLLAGAGGTLGGAIAERFLREGAHVVAMDREPTHLEELERHLPDEVRERCRPVVGDVVADADVRRVAELALDAGDRIDVLVNNAGISGVVPVVEMDEDEWDRVFDVNAKGAFLLARAVLPGMLKRGEGAIVNIASQAGRRGEPFTAHYCAAKAAVINFSRALALEVAPQVRVNTVCPGYVESAMTRTGRAAYAARTGASPDDLADARRAAIPLGAFQSPEDIAAAVCFLSSPDASSITGLTMDVNGGESMS